MLGNRSITTLFKLPIRRSVMLLLNTVHRQEIADFAVFSLSPVPWGRLHAARVRARVLELDGVFVPEERSWKLCNWVGSEKTRNFSRRPIAQCFSSVGRFTDFLPLRSQSDRLWRDRTNHFRSTLRLSYFAALSLSCWESPSRAKRKTVSTTCLSTKLHSYELSNWKPQEAAIIGVFNVHISWYRSIIYEIVGSIRIIVTADQTRCDISQS